MKKPSNSILPFAAIIALIVGCAKNDQFDDTPHLEWLDHEIVLEEGNRRNIILTSYFTDGDGNIGSDSSESDCPPVETYDLFVSYFEKVGDSYVEITPPDTCQRFHTFLPDLMPEGQNKTLEGEISATFSYLAYPENADVDSVKFELQLKDREGNESEIVSSDAIFIPPL